MIFELQMHTPRSLTIKNSSETHALYEELGRHSINCKTFAEQLYATKEDIHSAADGRTKIPGVEEIKDFWEAKGSMPKLTNSDACIKIWAQLFQKEFEANFEFKNDENRWRPLKEWGIQ